MRFATAAALVLLACSNNAEPRACTQIGCHDGLAVEISHSLQQSFNVEVRSGTQVIHTFRCDPGQPCRAFLDGQTPAQATVVVQAPQGAVTRTFQPTYATTQPNGPDCPPVCRQATVTVTVS